MLTHAQPDRASAEAFVAGRASRQARRQLAVATCRWPGSATPLFTLVLSLVVRLRRATARRARRRCSATCASSGPTSLLAPPRIWENMLTAVQVRAADASPLKRARLRVFPRRRRAARAAARRRQARAARRLALGLALGEFFVYGPVRDQLGLRQRALVPTPAARRSGPDTFRFFRSFGVNLKQVYGATEASGAGRRCRPTARPIRTPSGRPCPGIEVQDRRARRGAGPAAPACSWATYKQDEATREAIDADGWLQHRRRRLHRPARPPRHHRPRQGRRQACRRHAVRAAVHREQAEVQPVHPRGGGVRRPAAVRGGDDRHRHAAPSATGPSSRGLPYTSFMDLARQARGRAADRRGDRQGQRDAAGRRSRSGASCCSTRSSTPTTPR